MQRELLYFLLFILAQLDTLWLPVGLPESSILYIQNLLLVDSKHPIKRT